MMDGKNILVYKSRGAKNYSKTDIISIIKRYKPPVNSALGITVLNLAIKT